MGGPVTTVGTDRLAGARRKTADTATKTSPEKAREEAGAPRAPLEQNAEKKRKPRASQKGDRKRVRVSEGVYRDQYGLAATVKVNGIQREKRYPRDTGLRTIQAWRAETRGSLVTLPKAAKHTLEHDAGRYLHHPGRLPPVRERASQLRRQVIAPNLRAQRQPRPPCATAPHRRCSSSCIRS